MFLQLALLVLWSMHPDQGINTSILVAVFNLLASISMVGMSHLEHRRSIRPSTLLCGYLLLSVVLDSAQLRTLYLLGQIPIDYLFSASWVIKMVMLIVESQEKTACLKPEHQSLPPESRSGIINRSFLWWLNQLFSIGSQGIISETDLFELDSKLAADNVGKKMLEAWETRRMLQQLRLKHLLNIYRTSRRAFNSHLHFRASSLSPIWFRDLASHLSHRFYLRTAISHQQSPIITGGGG